MAKYILSIVSVLAFVGCVSRQMNRDLDEKVKLEAASVDSSDLRKESEKAIALAPGLSNRQREQLSTLRDSVRAEMMELNQQALGLRSVLIKDVLAANYNPDEVDLIKDRLRKIEHRKLNVLFETIAKAETILGKQGLRDQGVYDAIINLDFPRAEFMR